MRTKKAPTGSPPRNFVAWFDLVQAIGSGVQQRGKAIKAMSVHAPVFHHDIMLELENLRRFCDRALSACESARKDWEKEKQT